MRNADVVGPFVTERKTHGEARPLRPLQVRAEARRLPGSWAVGGSNGIFAVIATLCTALRFGAPTPKERDVATAQVKAHSALESATRRCCRQQVDVCALDGSGRLPDLALAKDRAGLWAEGDAAAAAALEVHSRQAQVVCIGQNLNLQVHAAVRTVDETISLEPTTAVGDFIRLLHVHDFGAAERRAELRHLAVEKLAALLPSVRDSGHLPRDCCL
mmetsp:Transcript_32244/g.68613  ORF Transcript_32244/g.68613 Transcript_32244/m.68613 type:complete len:216 (+) Transcript_32244:277-924(+)